VCRRFQLAAELCVRQPKRFGAPQLLRIAVALRHRATRTLFLALVHSLLNAVLCVDESFTCICHLHLLIYRLQATGYQLTSYQ
jgi:hypothetical protein